MPIKRNRGIDFDPGWLENIPVFEPAVEDYVEDIKTKTVLQGPYRVGWLLRAITCLDLTTLCGDDSYHTVERLCNQAANPLPLELLKPIHFEDKEISIETSPDIVPVDTAHPSFSHADALDMTHVPDLASGGIHAAAVCVYPARVKDCKKVLSCVKPNIAIASVAGGFPSGQYHIRSKVLEIELAIQDGATEIDVTINRAFALCGDWEALYDEVKQMRKACGEDILMKTILATGELGSLRTVYQASLVCMMAGSDFIKTSTGKEKVNATLPVGTVMARAIKAYEQETGFQVGFKPAGGIRTAQDALYWQMLMRLVLGKEWLHPELFRIGASGLLHDIQKEIYYLVKKSPAPPDYF